MPRFKATKALRKVNPLIEQGHRVAIPFSNTRAFESRKVGIPCGKYGEKTYTYNQSRIPTKDLLEWLAVTAGPRDVLWTTKKTDTGIDIFFLMPAHAMMAKLTWGGL